MRAAILLNGCGAKDGSEIHEAVFSLCALQEQGFKIQAFAIDEWQYEVINHLNGQAQAEKRSMLIESARIARGAILPLTELRARDFNILVIPGGTGSAKNLCNYFYAGPEMRVREDVASVIMDFFSEKKPIGAVCIAPMIVGKVLGSYKVRLTLGADAKAHEDLASFGAVPIPCPKGGVVLDEQHRIVSTPAYMHGDSTMPEVFTGISKMAQALRKFC